MPVHKTAILIGEVILGSRTYVGPYSVIGWPATDILINNDVIPTDIPKLSSRVVKIDADSMLLSHVVVGEGTVLGASVWCDHYSRIGSGTSIGDGVQIMYNAQIYDRVKIGAEAWVGGFVCNDAIIESRSIMLGSLIHKFTDVIEGTPEKAPIVREEAFVGMGAIIIGNVEVGPRAYISAGSLLTKSAVGGRLYVGTPARDAGPAPSPFKVRNRS
jgi:UDP-2-acetamido-3-amino-2,3-dideoxy-glucuronate N-acetyltransferase